MGKLTTHVLDTAHGKPAAGIAVRLRLAGKHGTELAMRITDVDGRTPPLLDGDALKADTYELIFEAGSYFDSLGLELRTPKFIDQVVIRFGVSDSDANYHVPLLLSPYGYSTYRGS